MQEEEEEVHWGGCEGVGPPLGVQGRQRGGSASGVQERGRGLKVHEGDTDRVKGEQCKGAIMV